MGHLGSVVLLMRGKETRHPIRRIKPKVDRALSKLSPTFSRMYAANGRALILSEHLL